MGKTCVAVRHLHFEDLGTWEDALGKAGFAVRYLEAVSDDLGPAADADLAVFLGGPIGVHDADVHAFLARELEAVRRRLGSRMPTIGVCLGAQLIARAAGAAVYPGANGKEIGWGPLRLTDAGRDGLLAPLGDDDARVLHWHGDTFDLPDGATLLASTDAYANQIFAIGGHALGLQCHVEIDPAGIERWLVGHAVEIAGAPGVDTGTIRRDTARFGAGLVRRGRRILEDWLARAMPDGRAPSSGKE